MSYAQQSRSGAPRRPQHEHSRPPFGYSGQAHAFEVGESIGSASKVSDVQYQLQSPHQDASVHGSNRHIHGHDTNDWEQDSSSYENHGGIAKRSERGGLYHYYSQQQIHDPELLIHNDWRYHELQQPRNRPSERAHRPQRGAADSLPRPRNQQGQVQRRQHNSRPDVHHDQQERFDDAYNYGDHTEDHRDDRTSAEEVAHCYNYSNHDDPHGQPRHAKESDSDGVHTDTAEAPMRLTQQYVGSASKGTFTQQRTTSQPSKGLQRSQGARNVSPTHDRVTWDNPFPAFPIRSKEERHAVPLSVSGFMSESHQGHERPSSITHDDQPQNSSSRDPLFSDLKAIQDGNHPDEYAPSQKGNFGKEALAPYERDSRGQRIRQLRPPMVNGRYSEDAHIRPSVPMSIKPNSSYERSKTMPTAVSDAMLSTGPQRLDTPVWQEPGPVAGYFGPEDRDFLPYGPIETSRNRPAGQERVGSAKSRFHGHAAVSMLKPSSRHLHAKQDSLNDQLENYYDKNQQDQKQYPLGSLCRSLGDKEMPNFDASPGSGISHRQDMTNDHDLLPELGLLQHPDMSESFPSNSHMVHAQGPYSSGQTLRSRSQPNLKDKRSPVRPNDGFDFDLSNNSDRTLAMVPDKNGYNPSFSNPTGSSNYRERSQGQDRYLNREDRTFMNAPAPGIQPHFQGFQKIGSSGCNHSVPIRGQQLRHSPPTAIQDYAPSDRSHSFPKYATHVQNDQQESRQNLPSMNDHRTANSFNTSATPTKAQPDRYHPSPTHDSHSPESWTRPLGQRSSPRNREGPYSPPPRSVTNPDALPSHPPPMRAGLVGESASNHMQKPAPIRQYIATSSSAQLPDPSQFPVFSKALEHKSDSNPVTYQELDKLKQATARNPDDQAAQLHLAKKLVEAASVLVDERADPRSRNNNRKRYLLDAQRVVKKVSNQGSREATFYLADSYSRGALALESDTREAFKLYQTAAKAGHAQAAYRVAVCCEIGQEEGGGTNRDPVKAMQWYKRAATLGDTPAMYKMGIISLKGLLGQSKNTTEALIWLKRAAERADRENPHALHELALLYEKPGGIDGLTKDEAHSKQLFKQAANLGYKFSQFRLGCAYEYGLTGCQVDPRQSIAWYSKAAVQEEHQSELALSGWYLTGSEGVLQQSDTEAYLWARKAAQAGLAKAEYAMGYFTEVGIGVSANVEDAKRWYWRSASQNFQKARDRLEELRKGGATVQKTRVSRSAMKRQSEGDCILM